MVTNVACYSYYIMEWFMQALLVRVFSILSSRASHLCLTALPLFRPLGLAETCRHTYDHDLCSHGRYVSTHFPFSDTSKLIYITAMSIVVLVEASGAVFYNINTQLAYLCLQVGLTLIYTFLWKAGPPCSRD
jgi:hypothetical protein